MGETTRQRLELAYSIKDLSPNEVPINILIPKSGTPFENLHGVNPIDAIKTIAVWRFLMPTPIIKIAAGREVYFKDDDNLALKAGANGIITGGYLTTNGNDPSRDIQMIQDIGINSGNHYNFAKRELDYLRSCDLYRSLNIDNILKGSVRIRHNNQGNILNFCSNDYMGISTRKEVIKSTKKSLRQISPCSSRLITGNTPELERLEDMLSYSPKYTDSIGFSYRLHGKYWYHYSFRW